MPLFAELIADSLARILFALEARGQSESKQVYGHSSPALLHSFNTQLLSFELLKVFICFKFLGKVKSAFFKTNNGQNKNIKMNPYPLQCLEEPSLKEKKGG